MNCNACGKQKKNLRAVESRSFPGRNFYACSSCRQEGYEPRYLIILAIRSGIRGGVEDVIREGCYIGDRILAEEVV